MTENQNNDNLERFFKANLERYSPAPSSDFWARMEPVIPAKPPFWSGWVATAGKWVGLGLLIALLATLTVLWRSDHQKLARLSKTLKAQQQQIVDLGEKNGGVEPITASPTETERQAALDLTTQNPAQTTQQPTVNGAFFTPKNGATRAENRAGNVSTATKKNTPISEAAVYPKELTEAQTAENQSAASQSNSLPPTAESVAAADILPDQADQAVAENTRSTLPIPTFIAVRNTHVSTTAMHALALKRLAKPARISYPRFSFESGASAFVMPVGRLFTQDSLFTGKTRLSYNAGVLVNYEINPALAFQTGFQYKDIRATKLVLRYNSFPFLVRRQWAWGHRGHVEAKAGLSLNTLLNARTQTDGLAVKGLKTTWLGCQGSLGFAWPISQKLTLIAGPNLGFTLTRIADKRRTWEAGLGLNLRYQI